VLVVHPSLGVKSVKELVALAKKEPGNRFRQLGQRRRAAPGHGTLHVHGRIKLNHVPYRQRPAQQPDVGNLKVSFVGTPIAIPHMKSGS